jgi:hypothetical protein
MSLVSVVDQLLLSLVERGHWFNLGGIWGLLSIKPVKWLLTPVVAVLLLLLSMFVGGHLVIVLAAAVLVKVVGVFGRSVITVLRRR